MQLLLQKKHMTSLSCRIFFDWDLSRKKVREILRSLDRDRKLQTTFNNLIGATRFKAMDQGGLYSTMCPKCRKEIDSWEHHQKCYELEIPANTEGAKKEVWLKVIKNYLRIITTEQPAKYRPSKTLYEEFRKITQ